MNFFTRTTVGLDLGQHTLKVATLAKNVIQSYRQEPIFPTRETLDQEPEPERILELLRAARKDFKELSSPLTVVTPGEGTMARYLEFPALTPKELAVAAPAQALSQIPYPAEAVYLSLIPVAALGGAGRSGVFVVAIEKNRTETLQGLLKGANLKAARFEVPLLALRREFLANHSTEDSVALVHCGFRLTHILILDRRQPYYYREIRLAGGDFTYAFQQGERLSWAEAEAHKLENDAGQVTVSLEPFMQRWIKELKRTLAAYERLPGARPVTTVYLTGGTAGWKNLAQRVGRELKRETVVDNWEQLKGEAHAATFKVAAGLAMEN